MSVKVEIYQAKRDDNTGIDILFNNFDTVLKQVKDLDKSYKKYYDKKYEYNKDYKNNSDYDILEEVFYTFNATRPEDFTGHSLSVSDIVVIDGTPYFCDSFGWQKLD